MKRAIALACIAALAAASTALPVLAKDTVIAHGYSDPLIVPEGSPLHYKGTNNDGALKFDGRILISGRFHYDAGEDADAATLEIIPDKETWARLPHYKDHGTPSSLYLTGAANFAKAAGIKKHTASGKTQVWADRFEAGIECDVPYFSARFVELAKPLVKLAAKEDESEGC